MIVTIGNRCKIHADTLFLSSLVYLKWMTIVSLDVLELMYRI